MTDTQRVDVETALAEVIRLADVSDKLSGDYHEGNRAEADFEWAAVNFVREHAKHIAALLQQLAAAERAREEAEQDRWRTDWPEMTPVSDRPPSLWQSERVIVSLVGGRVTHDVAESFDGQRQLWFIHRDKVRAWQPFPAAFLAANGGRDHG